MRVPLAHAGIRSPTDRSITEKLTEYLHLSTKTTRHRLEYPVKDPDSILRTALPQYLLSSMLKSRIQVLDIKLQNMETSLEMPNQSNNLDPTPKYRPKATRLMDQVREVLRYYHYGFKTEQAYIRWILNFVKYNGTRHPREMGKSEIEAFLSLDSVRP